MKRFVATVSVCSALLATVMGSSARAEIVMGLKPNYTLNDIKAIYPNCIYADTKLGWLNKNQRAVLMGGQGLGGYYYLFFTKLSGIGEALRKVLIDAKRLGERSSEDSLCFLESVRFCPAGGVKLAQLDKAYGRHTSKLLPLENKTEHYWKNGTIVVKITSGSAKADYIDYWFSDKEILDENTRLVTQIIENDYQESIAPTPAPSPARSEITMDELLRQYDEQSDQSL